MKINHIALYVYDLEKAKNFFEKYFGVKASELYTNEKKSFTSYFLTFDDGASLEIMNKPDLSHDEINIERLGYSHIAISIGSKEKVDELTKKLRNDGYYITSNPRTTGDGNYESCVVDVEGNLIEITI